MYRVRNILEEMMDYMNGTGVKGMLEGKYFRNVEKVMPLLYYVLDICVQRRHYAPLTTIQVAYNEILSTALSKPNGIATREGSEKTAAIFSEQARVLK